MKKAFYDKNKDKLIIDVSGLKDVITINNEYGLDCEVVELADDEVQIVNNGVLSKKNKSEIINPEVQKKDSLREDIKTALGITDEVLSKMEKLFR